MPTKVIGTTSKSKTRSSMKNNRWECPSKEFATRFAERLKMEGYNVLKIAKHWGRWFVTVKNEEDKKK